MNWETLGQWVGTIVGSGVISAGALFAILKLFYSGHIQRTLERLRSELVRETNEHQIRFSHLHEKRAQVLATAYKQLLELKNSAASYTSIAETPAMGSREERARKLNDAHRAVLSYLPAHMIYLPEDTAQKADAFLELVWENVHKFDLYVAPDRRIDHEKWMEAWEAIAKDGKLLLHELASEFRKILDPSQPTLH